MSILIRIITCIIGFLQFKSFQNIYYYIHKLILSLMNYGIGVPSNGEFYCFNKIAKFYEKKKKAPVLFDVGSNLGQTIILFSDIFKEATIHSFEPNTKSYGIINLVKLENKNINLIKNNFGLSNVSSNSLLYNCKSDQGNGHSSLYPDNITIFAGESFISENVKLNKLDDYCKDNKINHIDFLKLDTEGNELNCLIGGSDMIKKGNIDFIQFEFNECAIGSRIFFKDYRFLLSKYYDFYRELSFNHGLYKIKKYNIFLENFYATNYLLIKKGIKF